MPVGALITPLVLRSVDLHFENGIDSIKELMNMLKYDDETLENYLEIRGFKAGKFTVGGLNTREEVEEYLELIKKIYMPVLKNTSIPKIYSLPPPPSGYVSLTYKMDNEKSLSFRVYFGDNTSLWYQRSWLRTNSPEILTSIFIGDVECFAIHHAPIAPGEDYPFWIGFYLDVNGYLGHARAYNYKNEEEALKDLKNFSFIQLKELLCDENYSCEICITCKTPTTTPPITTTPPTTTTPPKTTTTPPPQIQIKLGHILGNPNISIFDALELLKYITGMESIIDTCENARAAALIVSNDVPGIFDVLEILKALAGMESVVSG